MHLEVEDRQIGGGGRRSQELEGVGRADGALWLHPQHRR
jgi:hypothetical protein